MDDAAQLKTALADRYSMEREIGRGGMATVYLARDLKHDRNVALKVLNPELGAVLGVERFLAEIKVTANLQHPNLLPLFDSGEADGLLYYVMPFVDGESLRVRLAREKQLPVAEAVRIAAAIAGALEYAHQRGVIHRDLKPENILMQAGQPVIADFGIALAVSNAGGNRVTATGLSLGTPQYMSPEQATGDRDVDGRTDIYSLGAMLYEMLVGEPPHLGNTAQAVIARVLTEKPRSIRSSRPSVPAPVDLAVGQALAKLPADRFATAAQFAEAMQGRSSVGGERVSYASRVRPREIVLGVLLVAAIGAAVFEGTARPPIAPDPVVRFAMALPASAPIAPLGFTGSTVAISPDGDRVAYLSGAAGFSKLYVRGMDDLAPRSLVEGENMREPAFSPDGKWIAFAQGNELRKVLADGGPSVLLVALPSRADGITWANPATLIVTLAAGLFSVPAAGGAPRQFTHLDSAAHEGGQFWPVVLADGQTILYGSLNAISTGSGARIGVASLATGKTRILDLPGVYPLGVMHGELVYVTPEGTLMAVPFDARAGRPTGAPVALLQDVQIDVSGGARASLSASGTLVYVSGRFETQPVLVDSHGASVPLISETKLFLAPRFSPDGKRIAFAIGTTPASDIFIFDRQRATMSRLTNAGTSIRPEWTADGTRVLYRHEQGGVVTFMIQPADGSAPARELYTPDEDALEGVLSPDEKWLVYRTGPSSKHDRDIFGVPLTGDRKPVPLVVSPFIEQMPRISPDGHWLAYQSSETRTFEIYVRPFPGDGPRIRVSTDGGTEPVWSADGRTLYYRRAGRVVGVSVTTGSSFVVGASKDVLITPEGVSYATSPTHQNYDVSPDGHLLMLKNAGDAVQVMVVHNWARELAARTVQTARP